MTRKNQEFRKTREKAFGLEEEHGTEERWPSGKRKRTQLAAGEAPGKTFTLPGPQLTLLEKNSKPDECNFSPVLTIIPCFFCGNINTAVEKNNFIYQIFIEYITIGF